MNTELLPRYSRVKRMITDRIDSGEWQPRHRIPSESELVRDLGVSRMTINRALRELTLDGRLIRVQGVGTFVAEPKPISALFEVRNIADEITGRGHRHTSQVLTLRKEKASTDIAQALGLKTGEAVFHSVHVHSEDDMPVQIEDRYVVPALAPEYLDQDFSAQTPYVYLMATAPISEAEHVIDAVHATSAERKLLKIEPNEPCLSLTRTTWSNGRHVSYVRLLYPGGRYRLRGKFKAL
ncbi:histidine utilization repressor [Dongia deserti]|uniref:histidine utilization repressor n=1 Tax=Dongia deserti TaxID=2268030 RepID=UPI0025497290|nr:histidine utilization repressor [Dongia deserti]